MSAPTYQVPFCRIWPMEPFKLRDPAVVGVSGGRTSVFMARQIQLAWGGRQPDHIEFCFQNTGFERPETLDFLDRAQREWGWRLRWIEYIPPVDGESLWRGTYREVTYATASRRGEPFRAFIRSWAKERQRGDEVCPACDGSGTSKAAALGQGVLFQAAACWYCDGRKRAMLMPLLPHPAQRVCTRVLKSEVQKWWRRDHGMDDALWVAGLRYDEPRRVAKRRAEGYDTPLYDARVTKPAILDWWSRQPFDLPWTIEPMGNCAGCFEKGDGLLVWMAHFHPEDLEPFARLEAETGARFRPKMRSYQQLIDFGQSISDARADAFLAQGLQEDAFPCACTD